MDTQQTLEETTKVIEDTLDILDDTQQIVKNNPYLIVGVALFSLTTGIAIGYKVAKSRLTTKYEALAEFEVQQAREFYSALNKTGDFETPEKAVEKLVPPEVVEAMTNYQGMGRGSIVDVEETVVVSETVEGVTVVDDEVVTRNIFVNGAPIDDNFDYEAEVAQRKEDVPYVITQEEFFENAQDFSQLSFTYYEGDDVLVDEDDDPITDTNPLVGDHNLRRFGHGSKDSHIVYVKNNLRGQDYEIAQSRGKYTVEVLGLEDEDDRTIRPRKFRGGDE